MEAATISYQSQGPVGILTLNRPDSLNAVNQAMSRELTDFLTARLNDFETRVLIITGAGRGFCAGLDMKESTATAPPGGYSPKLAYEMQRTFSELIRDSLQ